ncbi:MAG TPA: TIGR03435 family protein [Acidobacteriaceae bacterium]|nr:TIGR03435 family protein [Acidobacteriaceae bacterium]
MGRRGYSGRKYWMVVAARIAVLVPVMLLMAGVPLWAQAVARPAVIAQEATATPAPHFTFDVVSIKPSGPNSYGAGPYLETGYSSIHMPLYWTVFTAYFSSPFKGNQIIGMPSWMTSEPYDVNARIDEADIPAWMNLTYAQRQPLRQPLLQQLLAERLKLAAHIVPAEAEGYVLIVGKGGPRFTPTKPGETYPAGAKDGWNGAKVVPSSADNNYTESYFNATMEDLANRLSWAWPIIDRTHLTGRYDFTFRHLSGLDADGKRIPDPQPADMWDVSATGLEIKRAKIPTQNLIIDHIERPSAN